MVRSIVVGPFWYTDDHPDSLGLMSGWVTAAAEFVDADYIVGALHWLGQHPEWMTADGLHPNDDGYAVMAGRMDAIPPPVVCPPPSDRRPRPQRAAVDKLSQ